MLPTANTRVIVTEAQGITVIARRDDRETLKNIRRRRDGDAYLRQGGAGAGAPSTTDICTAESNNRINEYIKVMTIITYNKQ
jgi:hypothetical protein